MDPQIEELKELVRRSIAVSEDTNKIVHKMHRSAIFSGLFRIVWWLAIAAITFVSYYLFVAPYIGQVMDLYTKAQQTIQNAPTLHQ